MKLENLEQAKILSEKLEIVKSNSLAILDRSHKTKTIKILRGGPNVDISIHDGALIELIESTIIKFYKDRAEMIAAEVEKL